MHTAFIKEIFTSIQGEALYIGQKQLFIRFCGCNLNCAYCDTNFEKNDKFIIHDYDKEMINPITPSQLADIVNEFDVDMVSLTGGEPLLYDDFLLEFFPLLKNKKIYLETNGTLPEKLKKVINFVDVVSMDIKLCSSTKQDNKFAENIEFIKIAKNVNKECFVKIVLDKNYSKIELDEVIKTIQNFDITLIIQPMDCKNKTEELDKESMLELFNFIYSKYKNIRLIPQVHKFLDLL